MILSSLVLLEASWGLRAGASVKVYLYIPPNLPIDMDGILGHYALVCLMSLISNSALLVLVKKFVYN